MKKYITFEEKILSNISLKEYVNFLNNRKVDGLEVAFHRNLLDFDSYKELAKESALCSIDLNYHIADFVIDGEYEIANIRRDSSIKDNFTRYYDNIIRIMDYAKLNPSTTITFHGAKVHNNDYDKAYDNTMFFVDFTLNMFEKRSLDFKLSCESLNSNISTFGDSRHDLLKLVEQFRSNSLGICWDVVHDTNNFNDSYTLPDEFFYNYINNVHIHGSKKFLNTINDHMPLYKSELDLDIYIKYLKDHSYDKSLTHELLSFTCSDYQNDLEQDLALIDQYFL